MSTVTVRVSDLRNYQGLKRWHDWLTERLSPAAVTLADLGVSSPNEYRWHVEFQSGASSMVRVPDTLVECGAEEFERVTDRLDDYGWKKAVELSGRRGLRISARSV